MSTTVTYKGSTLTTVNNQTRVLNTAGKWLEGDITLVDVTSGGITPTGALNISTNGTYDVTNYASAVVNVSGGGTPSATRHTLYFEYEDETTETEYAYYDDSFISSAITATTPTTRNSKTVTSAQLDGVEWYSYDPTSTIPLNTQLIDYTKCKNGYELSSDDGEEYANEMGNVTDYTEIDPTMTFTYVAYRWWSMAFYADDKTFISGAQQGEYADTIDEYDIAHGTLTPARIPSNAKYIRLTFVYGASSDYISLIRTA